MTKIAWVAGRYNNKKWGIGPAGGGAAFFYTSRDEWTKADSERVQAILDMLNAEEEKTP